MMAFSWAFLPGAMAQTTESEGIARRLIYYTFVYYKRVIFRGLQKKDSRGEETEMRIGPQKIFFFSERSEPDHMSHLAASVLGTEQTAMRGHFNIYMVIFK